MTSVNGGAQREQRLQEALAACIEALEAGGDREALLARYPEFAAELAEFFRDRDRIDRLASPPPATEMPTLAPHPATPAPLGTIRYLGDYELLEEIARGGMGIVFRARQVSANRVVAVKLILAGQLSSVDEVLRFRSEAEAAASLDHPYIVPIFEVGEHEGQQFYSMKLVQGGSLGQQLAQSPLAPQQAAQLLETVARAVHYAHQRGIIHRDLKPANILLDAAGQPFVTDFGLAKRVESDAGLTQTGVILGTPSYMAPEQAEGRGKRVGPAADVYALGAILYECLTGRPPFKAATAFDTIMQVVSDEPVPPRQLNARVPRDVETICLKCLQKEPARRYPTAEALAEDLARWQRGEPVRARPVSVRERAVKWARRRPAVAGLLAGIVLLTATALAVISGLYRNAVWQAGEAAREARRAQQAESQAETDRDRAQEQEALAGRQKNRAEEQLDRAERLLYASQIQAAQHEWLAGNPALAWENLDACRWDYRNLEHRYLFTLFNHNHVTLEGHTGIVTSVALSSDGTRIVSGSWDKTVKVWDGRSGKGLLTLKGHTNRVTSVALSSDGTRIVSGSDDGIVKVWDGRSGKELPLKGASGPVAISSDGKRIVSGSGDKTVKVWDGRSGKELLTLKGHTRVVTSVALSSDGTRIVSGSDDGIVKVWDAHKGKDLLTLKGHGYTGLSGVAISSDGTRIVSGSWDTVKVGSGGTNIVSGNGETVKVWDSRSGKELLTLKGHTGVVTSVALSSDGTRIVSGSRDDTVKVWDGRSGKELLTLKGHRYTVNSVALSSDGSRIVSGSEDGTVKVWDGRPRKDHLTLKGHTSVVDSVAISSDGARIVSGSEDKTVKVWNAATGKETLSLKGHTLPVTRVAISGDGSRIVSGGAEINKHGEVKVWDGRTGEDLLTFKGLDWVSSVALSSDGSRIVICCFGDVKVCDSRTGKELFTLKRPTDPVATGVALSSDGTRIASGHADGTVKVWDGRTGKELFTLPGGWPPNWVRSVALSSDGTRIVSGSEDGTLKVWDGRTGKELLTLKGHLASVNSVALSSDGTRIVSGSWDNVKVWDGRTGKHHLTLKGHTGIVTSVALSSDGTRIVSGGEDNTVKVWDARSSQDHLTLKGHTGIVTSVALSSDGTRIVSGSWDGTVQVWDSRSGRDLLTLKGHRGKVTSVALSSDGKRIFAQDASGKVLVWNSGSGQLLPNAPARVPQDAQQATPDGKVRVGIENGVIRVYRADLEQERQQREARNRDILERLARFDPDWHQEQLKEALAAKDDFAAAFHLYALARGCARSVALADKPGPREKQAACAVEWLRQAVARGYKDIAHLKQDTDLDALRGRDDFKKVLAEVEAAARPKKTKEP